MSNPRIKIEAISKQYRLGLKENQAETLIGKLVNNLLSPWKNFQSLRRLNSFGIEDESVFWALKDINFEVEEGEVLGIVGKNGAGKSTLLKILSQITQPTSGKVEIYGRVASLLEVGTGFHPELTGRENIYMNGTILGMTRKEINSKLDEIIDFSGVEKFIDTPVKFYSSGMKVRLGFSVAAHLEPEILIIDEVLAVGDFEFQKKCLGKMEDISLKEGRTVIFVSHDLEAIEYLCKDSVLLENGLLKSFGSTTRIIKEYINYHFENICRWQGIEGDDEVQILETCISSSSNSFMISADLHVDLKILFKRKFRNFVIGFNLISEYGHEIARVNYNDYQNDKEIDEGLYLFKFLIPKYTLASGNYSIEFDVAVPFIKKLTTGKSNLSFKLNSEDLVGNEFNIKKSRKFNSQIRANWFLQRSNIYE